MGTMPMSQNTARTYARILTRFVEYLFIYAVYTLIFVLATMTVIADICGAANRSWLVRGTPILHKTRRSLP
jgi:uncharacterized RDD family membrane protein YckC